MNKSRLLFFASLILLLIGNIFASDANLVLEWKFDNNDNQLIAQDSSGNSFDGQINNGTWIRRNAGHAIEWADEPGEGITCLYSNGSILDIKKQVSVEVKVKLYEYPASGYTVIASGGGWQIRVTDADFRVAIQVEGDDWPIARWNFRKIPLNEWVRLGFSWDENEGILCLYMNGVMEKEYSLFQNVTLRDLDPSGDYGNYGIRVRPKGAAWSQFSGAIDDFRIWEGIRTDWIDYWEPPTEVNNLNIDRTDDGAVLTWEKAYCVDGTDAASYNIYRYSPGNNEERELISSVTGFTALDPDCGRKKWNYAVTALDQYGNEGAETVVLLPGIGSIRGRIGCLEEGSLVVLDNVLVQIDNRSSLTDSEGYYFLEDILEGDYVVIFRKGGFHSAERELSVSAEQDLTLDVTMERRDLGETDLVLEWKFDNRDNEIIAQDSSGNGFDGQINNGTWTSRKTGYAIEWTNESGEGITYLYSEGSKLDVKEQVSVEVRFKLNEFPTKNYSVIAAGGGWQIRVKNNGELSIAIQVEGSPIARGQGNIPLNEWVRVGFTMDGVNALLRVYINGIMQREFQMFADKSPPRYLDPSGVYGNYGIRIRPEGAAWSQFSGAIDDLRIWDGIRTDWKDYWEPPTVVKNLNIDRTDEGAVLTWEKAYCADGSDAASYKIYRYSPDDNEKRELISNVTGFTALDPDCGRKKWYYAVTALDQYGNEGAETIVLLPGIGSIQGTIGYLDGEQWIAIENVQVKIEDLICLTNSDGYYIFKDVLEGDYTITFKKAGFYSIEKVSWVRANQDDTLDILMEICDTYPLPPEDFGVEIGDRGEVILRFNMTSGNAYGIDIPSRFLIYRAKEKAALFDETSKIDDVVGCESVPKEYQIIDIPPESGVLYYYAICSENEALLMTRGEIIEMNVPLLPIPSPTLPNNHQIIFDQNVILEWESEIGYDSYIIELSSSSNFKPEETDSISTINRRVEISDNLSQGIWYWRVKGLFSNMASSRFSDYYSFNLVLSSDEQIGPVPLFETDLKIVNIREENEVRIKWVSLEEMDVEVRIYTLDNKLVYQYTQKATPGLTELVWKFKGESLRAVRPGLHLVMFKGIGPDRKQIAVIRRLLFLN